jgi:hypothetical protein
MAEVNLNLQRLFKINIFIALFFGVSCAFLPRFVFWLYGLEPEYVSIWATRLVGGSILGFAMLMWFGMKSASAQARRAIALALLIQDAIGCTASIEFQLRGEANAFGWFGLVVYGVMALSYATLLFIQPKEI